MPFSVVEAVARPLQLGHLSVDTVALGGEEIEEFRGRPACVGAWQHLRSPAA
jgi:hypothetical protein